MTSFRPDMSVEEAISIFPIGVNEVEVFNESGEFAGYLTLESLFGAVQQGELTKPIRHFILTNAPVQSLEQHSISYSQFQSFFRANCAGSFLTHYMTVSI